MKSRVAIGAAAGFVLVAIALGTRFAHPPRRDPAPTGAVAGPGRDAAPATTGEATNGPVAERAGSDDVLCNKDEDFAARTADARTDELANLDDIPATRDRLRVSQSAEILTSVALMAGAR